MKEHLFSSLFIGLCFLPVFEVGGQVSLPEYRDFTAPVGVSAPGEVFNPKTSGYAAEGTPICAEWTRTAGPDESIVITGANLTAMPPDSLGKDTHFLVHGPNGFVKEAQIQKLEHDKAVITIDKDMPGWGMYLIWPRNKFGYGTPIAVNKTEAWWVGPEKVEGGSTAFVYGRNLSHKNAKRTSYVYVKLENGALKSLKVKDVNPYRVEFEVPDLPGGKVYEIWTHNGHGGRYGWSGPLKLLIQKEPSYPKTAYYNVKDFGARGDGFTDDLPAIRKAIEAASTAGSTVYFPKGEYMISAELSPKANTQWKGAGKRQTVIKCHPNFGTYKSMVRGKKDVNSLRFQDLSFDTNNNYRIKAGVNPAELQEPVNFRECSDIKFVDVNFHFQNYDVLRLVIVKNVSLSDCRIVGRASFVDASSNIFIDNCDFELTNDSEYAIGSNGNTRVSITNSTCRDHNNKRTDGWGRGRFFNAKGSGGSTRYHYIANNTTKDLTVRPGVDENNGEQLLWEGFVTKWAGKIESSTSNQTILKDPSKLAVNNYAIIIGGRGLGQARRIVSVEGATITLEKPWRLTPDASSLVAVSPVAEKIVAYENKLDGKPNAVTDRYNAAAGIQPYGAVINLIADGNRINQVRTGLSNYATLHNPEGVDPNYFNLFVNNKVTNSRHGILNYLRADYPSVGIGSFANIFRDNKVKDVLNGLRVQVDHSTPTASMAYCVFERNVVLDAKNGISRANNNAGIRALVLRVNKVNGADVNVVSSLVKENGKREEVPVSTASGR